MYSPWVIFVGLIQTTNTGSVIEIVLLRYFFPSELGNVCISRNLSDSSALLGLLAETFPGSSHPPFMLDSALNIPGLCVDVPGLYFVLSHLLVSPVRFIDFIDLN